MINFFLTVFVLTLSQFRTFFLRSISDPWKMTMVMFDFFYLKYDSKNCLAIFYLEDQLLNLSKGIEVLNRFFNILNICVTVIPYLTDIFWLEGYRDVNLAIDDIVMAFVKNWRINNIFWNYHLVSTKYKINTWQWVIYNLCRFVNDLCILCSRPVELVMSSLHQFLQRPLKPPVTTEQRRNASFIWLQRISNLCKRFRILLDID